MESGPAKATADEALALLKSGNQRFAEGNCTHPHTDGTRLAQAGTENQAHHAYATVLACSDSRGPRRAHFRRGHHGPLRRTRRGKRL